MFTSILKSAIFGSFWNQRSAVSFKSNFIKQSIRQIYSNIKKGLQSEQTAYSEGNMPRSCFYSAYLSISDFRSSALPKLIHCFTDMCYRLRQVASRTIISIIGLEIIMSLQRLEIVGLWLSLDISFADSPAELYGPMATFTRRCLLLYNKPNYPQHNLILTSKSGINERSTVWLGYNILGQCSFITMLR